MEFRFQDWKSRQDHPGLRDAWLATQELAARRLDGRVADCILCGRPTVLRLAGATDPPDLREQLVCTRCGLNTRLRAALHLLRGQLRGRVPAPRPPPSLPRRLLSRIGLGPDPPRLRVYVTEQATPAFVWMQKHLGVDLEGGEFEPDRARRWQLTLHLHRLGGRGRVAYRGLTALDFPDASLDAVASFEVLEHIPDYRAAIRQLARVLKPGGACVATFPFNDRPDTLVRARLSPDGTVEHLEPPEYHGDPLGGGILCYHHFGWDVLDRFREAGFAHAAMVMPWSLERALPYGMWTLLALR